MTEKQNFRDCTQTGYLNKLYVCLTSRRKTKEINEAITFDFGAVAIITFTR